MKYKIVSIENTARLENGLFNQKYHEKYIGKIGEEIEHNYKSRGWEDAILLCVERDECGKPTDADWFHKNDLVTEAACSFKR
jgi:hypothetical protein